MPFYPPAAPGGQFSGNTLRPTGPMPMQAQQGAQINSPTPSAAPAGYPGAGQQPTIPGVPPGGFMRQPMMGPQQPGMGPQQPQFSPQFLAAALAGHPNVPPAVTSNLRTLLGIR